MGWNDVVRNRVVRVAGPPASLRRDAWLANVNAAIWAIGNGLVSTTLIIYLALELGAKGLAISLLLASPRLAGVLRMATPALFSRIGSRKRLCIGAFVASSLVLMAIPLGGLPGQLASDSQTMAVIILAWSLYHLLEFVGAVALWSWLGDLYPSRIRGRLIGRRERWLVVGRIIGIGSSLLIARYFPLFYGQLYDSPAPRWMPLAASAAVGALFLLLSTVPLMGMMTCQAKPSAHPQASWLALKRFIFDRPYRRLLSFSCVFALANGITATPQSLYAQRVLGIDYSQMVLLRVLMRTGQTLLAGLAGRWIDYHGAKWMLFASQMVVATGPLFYWFATPTARWWIVGAYVVWMAYAGLNVGLDHLKLALAPQDNNAPALAAYHALSDLANAATVILGGYLFDVLSGDLTRVLPLYSALFLGGWVARSLAGGMLLRLIEPDSE